MESKGYSVNFGNSIALIIGKVQVIYFLSDSYPYVVWRWIRLSKPLSNQLWDLFSDTLKLHAEVECLWTRPPYCLNGMKQGWVKYTKTKSIHNIILVEVCFLTKLNFKISALFKLTFCYVRARLVTVSPQKIWPFAQLEVSIHIIVVKLQTLIAPKFPFMFHFLFHIQISIEKQGYFLTERKSIPNFVVSQICP